MVTLEDVEELLDDYEEAGWMVERNLAQFTDLTSGAVRQLDGDMLSMFELLSARITALENNKKETKT